MSGSIYGKLFQISTWGESHGKGLGVVVDGCPAGLSLSEEDIQAYLNKRKPGQTRYSTPRVEGDEAEILSGIFEGKTTGTPISIMVRNTSQRSKDYGDIAYTYRPGHADYTFQEKYGARDYRGGGRSSGRETIGRVAAGAIAMKILKELGVSVTAYVSQIGSVEINREKLDFDNIEKSPLRMPDLEASEKAEEYLAQKMKEKNSSGGMIECVVTGMKPGVGDTVFEKLDAGLAKAIMSIGAVKGVEIGEGMKVAAMTGAENNDEFCLDEDGKVAKLTNHAGGILGGMSDGSDIFIRAAFKPTPSIASVQKTVNQKGEEVEIKIHGRHDPIIVPRAVVVVESMVAITLVDQIFANMSSTMDKVKNNW